MNELNVNELQENLAGCLDIHLSKKKLIKYWPTFYSFLAVGDPKTREDAIKKCYYSALEIGATIFGLRNGGECVGAYGATLASYQVLGQTGGCKNGKGGDYSAMDVYEINMHGMFLFVILIDQNNSETNKKK